MLEFILTINYSYKKVSQGVKFPELSRGILLAAVCCIVLFFRPQNAVSQNREKQILIIFAESPSLPAYHILLDGIRQKFQQEFGSDFMLHTEYLEKERYSTEIYPKERFEVYNRKYKDINLDLLISIGVNGVPTIKKYADQHLLNLPVVSIDLDNSKYGGQVDLKLNDKTIEIRLKFDLGLSLKRAMELFPESDNIYIICGTSRADSIFANMFRYETSKVSKQKKVEFWANLSMDEVLKKVRNLPHGSLVIVSSFLKDNRSVPYYNHESIRLISREANAPVFTITDVGIGEGNIGGHVLSFRLAADVAGDAANYILKGGDPRKTTMVRTEFYQDFFDWKQLKRWHIEGSPLIPGNSIILNKETDFLAEYKWQIVFIILFVLLESVLILFLVRANRRQKTVLEQKAEAEFLYRKIFREERLQRMSELTASLSHELNQPLTATIYNAQALKRWVNSENPDRSKINDILDHIITDNKRAGGIISSIRSLMKLENREKENVQLNNVIHDTVRLCFPDINQHQVKVDLHVPAQPVVVSGDRIQLQQVLLNFISNANNAMMNMPAGERKLTITLKVASDQAVVSVSDTGPGIDKEIIDRIFLPFITSGQNGLGIGLALSRTIIENHGGKIYALNLPGRGAEFSFSLKILDI